MSERVIITDQDSNSPTNYSVEEVIKLKDLTPNSKIKSYERQISHLAKNVSSEYDLNRLTKISELIFFKLT